MSLTQALTTSLTGLRTTQLGLSLIASNVANADTPGFVRKTLAQTTTAANGTGVGVQVAAINRELDRYVQAQLRTELSGSAYADLRAQFYDRLQGLFGQPGSDAALETVFNKFTAALQALATSPDLYAARADALGAAQALAQQLNRTSDDIQELREDAEQGLAEAAASADDAVQHIAAINRQLTNAGGTDLASAVLLDQRDRYIEQLAQLMDVRVLDVGNGQVSVFTSDGLQLVGSGAAHIGFDPQGAMSPGASWSADASTRSVGTLTLTGANGEKTDLIASGAIRSGTIAAYLDMRDNVLVQAQRQLDAIAAAMSQALSDRTVPASAVTAGSQAGFDVDAGGLLAGNTLRVTYTDTLSNTQRTVTFVRVDDPGALPLADGATADPHDRVVGIDFAGGTGVVASQIAAALGAGFAVSNPSGSTLRILNAPGTFITVDAASATVTATALANGNQELPFFLDGGAVYAGAIGSEGPQSIGLAARLTVNAALLADPAKLIVYRGSPQTPAGDATRPDFLYRQLTAAGRSFLPDTGIGSAAAPFQGTIAGFLRSLVAQQGQAAAAAGNLKQGQDVVVNALRQRAGEASGVNVDQEMANLLNLQNAYAANARVLSAVKDLFDILLRM
jgi:flagellar hook-associated protein 1 FlgK